MTEAPSIPRTMRASVLLEAGRIEMQERPTPRPGPDEVLIEVRSVGVCGSDVHYYTDGRIGPYVVREPLILGHEVSGVVADVGVGVESARIGQRVALEPQQPCRRCRACKSGHHNLCPDMRFYATPPVDGTLCDYVTLPADFAHPVPPELSDHAAALLEPFSVGLWACAKAKVEPGSTVFITGAGPIGALTALAARAYGASEVVVSDLVQSRRDRILDFGASAAYDPREGGLDVAGLEADAFIECSGATPAMLAGIEALRPGGTAVMVGLGAPEMELPVGRIAMKEINVTGVFRYVDTWPKARDAALARQAAGLAGLDALVTAEFALEDAQDALTADSEPSSMKSVVVVSKAPNV